MAVGAAVAGVDHGADLGRLRGGFSRRAAVRRLQRPSRPPLALVAAPRSIRWSASRAKHSDSDSGASYLLAAHNGVLCAGSLAMCVGCAREVFRRASQEGDLDFFFCESPSPAPASGPLYFWVYAYYLSKYYELLDTALAFACRGAGPRHFGMHVYHHGCVLWMSWAYLEYRQTLAFGAMIANTATHILMYYYYARAALKLKTSWKRWVTRMQVIQFLTSFALLAATALGYVARGADCSGGRALLGNAAFNATLLVLFLRILAEKPTQPKKRS